MGENAGIESGVGEGTGSEQEQQSPGQNPAWGELLGAIPQELHGKVTPYLQNWDKGVQDKFQQVHSQYEPWKPYIDSGLSPEYVGQGLQLLQQMEENPRQVLEALAQYAGISIGEQGQAGDGEGAEGEEGQQQLPPEFERYQQMTEMMAQALVQQHEAEMERQETEELDREFAELNEKFKDRGEVDEQWVIGKLLADPDKSLEQAFTEYFDWKDQILTQASRPKVPTILGAGGSLGHSSGVDPTKLSNNDTKALVAKYAAAMMGDQG